MVVKIIPLPSQRLTDDIIAETKTAASFNSSYLAKVYDSFISTESGIIYMNVIMEYCKNGTLIHFLARLGNKPLEEDVCNLHSLITLSRLHKDLLRILLCSLYGLKYLVGLNLVHRDIKPENIMCTDGIFKLCDFGYVTKLDENTESIYTNCGTKFEVLFFLVYFQLSHFLQTETMLHLNSS